MNSPWIIKEIPGAISPLVLAERDGVWHETCLL